MLKADLAQLRLVPGRQFLDLLDRVRRLYAEVWGALGEHRLPQTEDSRHVRLPGLYAALVRDAAWEGMSTLLTILANRTSLPLQLFLNSARRSVSSGKRDRGEQLGGVVPVYNMFRRSSLR